MISKKKAKALQHYRDRLEAAKGFRKDEGLDDIWRRLNDLYRGRHFPETLDYKDRIAVNIAFATINVIAPSVAVNHPKTVVNATHPEDEDKAVILEAVVNYWWKKYDVLPEFQRAVKDFLIFGFGWAKTGYRFVEEEEDRPEADIEADVARQRQELERYAIENPDMAGSLPTDEEIRASIATTRKVVAEDAPFVERVSPHDVFVDPEATSPQDMRWIAQRVTKTIEELKDNEAYRPSGIKAAKPDGRMTEEWFQANPWIDPSRSKDDDAKRYTVWEFYDLQHGTMCVFPESGDEFLVEPTSQPYAFGHPFVMLRNYEIPDVFYPMGELEALEPLQHELNLTRTAMFNDRKSYRRAWLYRPEAFDAHGRGQLASEEDNRLIPVVGNAELGDAIIPLPGQQPNPQLYQDSELIEGDITNITGINEYMRGALPEIRRTATEAAIIQDVANARAADKLAKVEGAISAISQHLVQLAQQYMTEPQVARIIGGNDRPFWFEFAPDDIEGEFDFDVEGGSTQPLNETQRRQDAMELLNTLAPFGDPMMGLVNMQALIAHVLKNGFGMKDVSRFMGPGPQAMMPPPGMGEGAPPEKAGAAPPPVDPMMAEAMMAQGDPALMMQQSGEAGGIPPELLAQLMGQVPSAEGALAP